MTTIGIIGSGNIGTAVAKLATRAGYDVVLANSRGPETLSDLVAELRPKARAATATEAGQAGDIVVVTVPLRAIADIPAEPTAGKLLIDTNNYYPERDGRFEGLDEKRTTTARIVQDHFPDATVVKTFSNIGAKFLETMGRPRGADDRNTLVIAGDDAAAKEQATELLDAFGYDVLDSGSLDDSWRYENGQPAYAAAYTENGDFTKPRHRSAAELQELLDQAER